MSKKNDIENKIIIKKYKGEKINSKMNNKLI